jgi:FlaA1/EpsC-like NDP-sugar epimerase
MLPRLEDILEGKVSINQIRPLAIEDLLQRPPVDLNPQPVQRLIEGKRILVTGAGGSIGSELCRQIVGLSPKTLVLYERHENSLYTIGSELTDHGHNLAIHLVLGDITDIERLNETLEEYRPEIIFHAAAHKHVPLMEMNPGEALKNNVLGTRCVAETAIRFGVGHFVLISTDKAVNPSSVMGATKRAAELVVQTMAQRGSTCFLTVRFGNVLGSNGSVVPRFQEQIRAGGPVTVTHPEVRRYFMSIPEAVGLVLQAATLGEQGAIYLLEMGDQIKLVDLARNLIGLSGHIPEKEIAIEFVGLRPGEKLEEELVGREENAMPSSLEKILKVGSRTSVDGSFLLKVQEMAVTYKLNDHDGVIKNLQHLIPTFIPTKIVEQNGSSGGVSPQVESVSKSQS